MAKCSVHSQSLSRTLQQRDPVVDKWTGSRALPLNRHRHSRVLDHPPMHRSIYSRWRGHSFGSQNTTKNALRRKRERERERIPDPRLYAAAASLQESRTASRSPDRCNPLSVPGVSPLALLSGRPYLCFFFFWCCFVFCPPTVLQETPERHPCQVQLALLGAGEQLSLQALLDFRASCPLAEILPAACGEHLVWHLKSASLLFSSRLSAIDDQNWKCDMTATQDIKISKERKRERDLVLQCR